jgi:hypothetical protein
MLLVTEDFIALVRDPAYDESWFVEGNSGVAIISDYTADYVAGASFDLPIASYFFGDRCQVPASALPSDTVDIISTSRDYTLIQFENTTDTNTFTLASLVGKSILTLIREDMPQVPVLVSTPVDDWTGTDTMERREFSFDNTLGTVTWAEGNNLFPGEVISILCK